MDIKFTEMSVDTSLAQEYIKQNADLSELYNDYNRTILILNPYAYDGKLFHFHKVYKPLPNKIARKSETLQNLASSLKRNATLITQLEYHIRNIPIEDTNVQLSLLIQKISLQSTSKEAAGDYKNVNDLSSMNFSPNDPLLKFGHLVDKIWNPNLCGRACVFNESRETAAICHLFVTLCRDAGAEDIVLEFRSDKQPKNLMDIGMDAGTVAVVSEDADVDSAVDKFLSVSKQAPWRLRKILVQENVYQQFKDALRWKCTLKNTGSEPPTSQVLCFDTLTYDGRTFLIDPVQLVDEQPSVVTVEAYRTTKEMISLVLQHETHYLSLWTNNIAEMNEVTHSTKQPVVWVNNIADFRGPPQVTDAVFTNTNIRIKKCENVAKLCELSKSWLKLDLESRRDILYDVLDKYITLSDPANKLYADIKNSLSDCTIRSLSSSFVEVSKDYVCMGISQPVGIVGIPHEGFCFSVETFKLLLQGNALIVYTSERSSRTQLTGYNVLEQAGVPVVSVGDFVAGDFELLPWHFGTRIRVVWTNSGTIFAN